jgi:hypothetical protein
MAYTLTSSAASVNEGSNVTITVYTTGLPNGTLLPYSIFGTGITADDFDGLVSLNGNFRIGDNRSTLTLFIKRDRKTELNETFTLRLPSTGNNESINILINDTSRTTNVSAKFYVTSPSTVVNEGDIARFDVTAVGIASGTVVPYRILGISGEDLAGDAQTTGILTFVSNVAANETYANVTLPIFEDFFQEGPESIVLIIEPDFPYSLELASSITVRDTSREVDPVYNIIADKTSVLEGGNVTFTLFTKNVPVGAIIPWQIQQFPLTKDTLTLSDFKNLSSFSGNFPPLVANLAISSNVASITFSTRDDFIFEQGEDFYLLIPNTLITSQIVRILDSGNTFITSNDPQTGNIIVKPLDSAILTANIGSLSTGTSYWQGTTGLLSEDNVLQGKTPFASEESLAFYHPFSYVIRSRIPIEKWRDSIKSLLHPAGLTIFGEINNETTPREVLSLQVSSVQDTTVSLTDFLTTDDTEINASNTVFAGSNITVDSITLGFNL